MGTSIVGSRDTTGIGRGDKSTMFTFKRRMLMSFANMGHLIRRNAEN